jgi:acyl-coenzyme A thioesterase PaaI-like protein
LFPSLTASLLSWWPPFWFTGIRFTYISPDFRQVTVRMALRFYNKNVVGIQYGGNLFSMTDPCYMMLLMHNLGRQYKVIDQSASIEFIKPGVATVIAHCQLTDADVTDIVAQTAQGEKYLKTFAINIHEVISGDLIAKVTRVVYIRKKLEFT